MTSAPALLPNEPRVIDAPRQQALTEQYLLPAIRPLMALMQGIRSSLDPVLRATQPMKWGKPYPLGQCLEISLAAKRRLRELNPATLTGEAAQGHAALAAFWLPVARPTATDKPKWYPTICAQKASQHSDRSLGNGSGLQRSVGNFLLDQSGRNAFGTR